MAHFSYLIPASRIQLIGGEVSCRKLLGEEIHSHYGLRYRGSEDEDEDDAKQDGDHAYDRRNPCHMGHRRIDLCLRHDYQKPPVNLGNRVIIHIIYLSAVFIGILSAWSGYYL